MTVLYAQTGYTLDPGRPIPEGALPAVGLTEDEADEVREESEAVVEAAQGPLKLKASDVDSRTLEATVEFEDGNVTLVTVDWGDGHSSDFTSERTQRHTYGYAGYETVVAHAVVDGSSYVVAKTRAIGHEEPPEG